MNKIGYSSLFEAKETLRENIIRVKAIFSHLPANLEDHFRNAIEELFPKDTEHDDEQSDVESNIEEIENDGNEFEDLKKEDVKSNSMWEVESYKSNKESHKDVETQSNTSWTTGTNTATD